MVLGGGEDYELLVALPPGHMDTAGVDLIEVGRVVEDGLWLTRDGVREELSQHGWDHFRT
jgi:thiamine monophosphate kinase